MGDRAMAEIKTPDGSLYVYTHWSGYSLPEDAVKALEFAKSRWGDIAYVTRIVVDQLTKESRDETTGYGLLLKPDAEDEYNNNSPSVIIDLIENSVIVKRNSA